MAKHKPYDLIFVFGYPPTSPDGKLSSPAKLNALAAGKSFRLARAHSLMFSGGQEAGAPASQARLMADFAKQRFHLHRDACILLEQPSNSVTHFIALANWLDKHPYQLRIQFLSLAHHLERVQMLAERFGIAGDFASAQDLLSPLSLHYRRWLQRACDPNSATMQAFAAREMALCNALRSQPLSWVPLLGGLTDRNRLQTVLRHKSLQAWLAQQQIDPNRLREKELRAHIAQLPLETLS